MRAGVAADGGRPVRRRFRIERHSWHAPLSPRIRRALLVWGESTGGGAELARRTFAVTERMRLHLFMLVLFRSYITNRSNLLNDARIQNLIRSVGHTFSSKSGSLAVGSRPSPEPQIEGVNLTLPTPSNRRG